MRSLQPGAQARHSYARTFPPLIYPERTRPSLSSTVDKSSAGYPLRPVVPKPSPDRWLRAVEIYLHDVHGGFRPLRELGQFLLGDAFAATNVSLARDQACRFYGLRARPPSYSRPEMSSGRDTGSSGCQSGRWTMRARRGRGHRRTRAIHSRLRSWPRPGSPPGRSDACSAQSEGRIQGTGP